MNRTNLLRVLGALALVALGGWLFSALEKADVEIERPAQGEAAHNPLYATQQLLRKLGMTVETRKSLETLPPANARLVLSSRHWQMLPGREAQLRRWVEQGGHLILPASSALHAGFSDWVPLQRGPADAADDEDDATDEADQVEDEKPPAVRSDKALAKKRRCQTLTESGSQAPRYAGGSGYAVCKLFTWTRLVPKNEGGALWNVQGRAGAEAVRVAVGAGTVTAVGDWTLLNNDTVLKHDHALLTMAALQARDGTPIWFVAEESRPPFLLWLWDHAWAAGLLGLLALGAALWRGAMRFGPLVAPAATGRRSMGEQVRGTGQFMRQHGRAALHAAQLRALEETAARQIHGYRPLVPALRAQAIARFTALPHESLQRAMTRQSRRPGELAADLELLETARRRLDANGPFLSQPAASGAGAATPPASSPSS